MTTRTHRQRRYDGEPFYIAHPRLRTREVQERTRDVLAWVAAGCPEKSAPDETTLFEALHYCARRAVRGSRASSASGDRDRVTLSPAAGQLPRRQSGGLRRSAAPVSRRTAKSAGMPAAKPAPERVAVPESSSPTTRRRWYRAWYRLREVIVERNLGLVYTMMERFRTPDSDDDDLVSEAMLSLTRAVDRFNPWRGFRFSTYACNCIARACMRRSRLHTRQRTMFPVAYDATLDSPYEPEDNETGLRIERLQRLLETGAGHLTALESRVIHGRFPLNDKAPLTFRQLARAVGLSKERVRQIQNEALLKLRNVLMQDPFLQ